MPKPIAVTKLVEHEPARRAAYARQAETGKRQEYPGWVVIGLFIPAEDGEPVCVDYRARSVVNTHDLFGWTTTASAIADSMIADFERFPIASPTPSGIPRLVFEKASQSQLLKAARETLKYSDFYREHLAQDARSLLAASEQRKTGRPPSRGLPEKLRILHDVEHAFETGEPSMDDVAEKWLMSRSGLRDLLTWARHTASPRLFTGDRPGQRVGRLTPEARALLDEIERSV